MASPLMLPMPHPVWRPMPGANAGATLGLASGALDEIGRPIGGGGIPMQATGTPGLPGGGQGGIGSLSSLLNRLGGGQGDGQQPPLQRGFDALKKLFAPQEAPGSFLSGASGAPGTALGSVGAEGLSALGYPALAESAAAGGSPGLAATGPLGAGQGGGASPSLLSGLNLAASGAPLTPAALSGMGAQGIGTIFGSGASNAIPGAIGSVKGPSAAALASQGAGGGAGAAGGGGAGAGAAGGGIGAGIAAGAAVAIPALMLAGIKGMRDRSKARDKAKNLFQQGVSQAPPTTINGATGRAVEFQGKTFLAQPGSFLVLDSRNGTLNQIDFLKGVAGPISNEAVLLNNAPGKNLEEAAHNAYRSFGIEPTDEQLQQTLAGPRKREASKKGRTEMRTDPKTGQKQRVKISAPSRMLVRQGR